MWLRRIRRGEGADGNEKKGMRFRRRWRRRRSQSPKTFGGKRRPPRRRGRSRHLTHEAINKLDRSCREVSNIVADLSVHQFIGENFG